MYQTKQISREVDTWIVEEELPVRSSLKVIRMTDPDYGLTEDEIMDRNEFIRCYLMQDFDLLIQIPNPEYEHDFFIDDCDVSSPEYSASHLSKLGFLEF